MQTHRPPSTVGYPGHVLYLLIRQRGCQRQTAALPHKDEASFTLIQIATLTYNAFSETWVHRSSCILRRGEPAVTSSLNLIKPCKHDICREERLLASSILWPLLLWGFRYGIQAVPPYCSETSSTPMNVSFRTSEDEDSALSSTSSQSEWWQDHTRTGRSMSIPVCDAARRPSSMQGSQAAVNICSPRVRTRAPAIQLAHEPSLIKCEHPCLCECSGQRSRSCFGGTSSSSSFFLPPSSSAGGLAL